MTNAEFKIKIEYLKQLADNVSTSKFFIVDLALEELSNVYVQKQKIYKEMKKLKTLTINKSYNLKDSENEVIHPLIKAYKEYNKEFLNTLKRITEIIKDLTDVQEANSKNKLKGFQNRVKEERGKKNE